MFPSELKRQTRLDMRETRPYVWWTALIYLVAVTILSLLISRLSGYSAYMENVNSLMQRIQSLGPKTVEELYAMVEANASNLFPSVSSFASLMTVVLSIVYAMLQAGFSGYCLLVSRRAASSPRDLMLSFEHPLKVFLILFLSGLFILLWSVLLVIPGIIAAFRYSQAILIHYDHPEYSAWQCIRESSRMMRGRKIILFLLIISFILWFLLDTLITGIIRIPILQIFLAPYYGITRANFYNRISDPSVQV
ncbi:MAG: DUF975 family protein [Oscillospiraceae bacterium]|nr:DUF975 family protein [Oscillospiraceae bacterium]